MLKKIPKETEKKFVQIMIQKGYDTFPMSIFYNFENTDEESKLFSIATGYSPLATRNCQLAAGSSQLATPQLAFFPHPFFLTMFFFFFFLRLVTRFCFFFPRNNQ